MPAITPRHVVKRKVDFNSRAESSKRSYDEKDIIKRWDALIRYCYTQNSFTIKHNDKERKILKLSEFPCTVQYSIHIRRDFHVTCYKGNTLVPVREQLRFAANLEKYSQLNNILSKMVDLAEELKSMSERIGKLAMEEDLEYEQNIQLEFLKDQLYLQSQAPNNRRYNPSTMNIAISSYLTSRNCYAAFRDSIVLPHPKTIPNYFGKLRPTGSLEECSKMIITVFKKLDGAKLFCKILVDEIHMKASVRYRGGHVVGSSVDQHNKAAKTVFALVIDSLMGAPAFVARLLPIFSLKSDLLFEQIEILVKLIHDADGYLYLVMSDN